MYKLSDEQVDFILDEIKARGVTIEDLQWNLLDHMCCIIEREMSDTDDFDRFFTRLLPRFFQDNLREIQEETELLLTFKHFYAMKKTLNITGLLSTFLTLTGAVLKIMHWPGAGITIVMGAVLFSLVFLPLMIALKFRDDGTKTDKWVLSFGFLIGISTSVGFLFKIMHWPFANVLIFWGLIAFLFAYIPMYFVTRIRRPELKFNTIVNTVLMMATGGLLFSMYNMGYSHRSELSNRQAYVLLNDEVSKIKQPIVQAPDSALGAGLHVKLQDLEKQLVRLKYELLASNLKLSLEEVAKMGENTAFSESRQEEVVERFASLNCLMVWQDVQHTCTDINKVITQLFPQQPRLKFEFWQVDFQSSTTRVALQTLTVMQLHTQVLENAIH